MNLITLQFTIDGSILRHPNQCNIILRQEKFALHSTVTGRVTRHNSS